MKKQLILKYNKPADLTMEGWEKYSLPVGNGYSGASVFGGVKRERVQFTTNVFANDFNNGGVSNFAEIYINSSFDDCTNYVRCLNLRTGTIFSSFKTAKSDIERNAFFSYPDKVFVYNIKANRGKADFNIELVIPYLNSRPVKDGGRVGKVYADGNALVMRGELPNKNLTFEARLKVITDGTAKYKDGNIIVKNSGNLTLFFVLGTSYKLCSDMFLAKNQKAMGKDPNKEVIKLLNSALNLGWDKLLSRHLKDYQKLIGRVELDLGGKESDKPTDELLDEYKRGKINHYLEELYFAFGRHLLVSSSRKNTPPASLQGVWSAYDKSPWGSGFWHNINVQMNYWPAFSTNLKETFEAYAEFNKAYRKQAEINADNWIKATNPENYVKKRGENGWIIGTGAFCYEIEGRDESQHSGPGTGALTTKMFWDYYDFTRDEKILKKYTYPAIHGMAKFLTKCVRNYDGKYLCSFSASPEQILSGEWVNEHKIQQYYHTVGCSFDQQMIAENAKDDIDCSKLLKITDDTVKKEKEQLDKYDAVRIGYSGQIKEYGEENFYGEIGEAHHRHLSQLVALFPGTQITNKTPAWQDSAKRTLQMRGDKSTGWALAHRVCAWTRTGD